MDCYEVYFVKMGHVFVFRFTDETRPAALRAIGVLASSNDCELDWNDAVAICESIQKVSAGSVHVHV